MGLIVKIRRDTGTLWITGTVKPIGVDRGYRIRKRAVSDDISVAEMEASKIEREILISHKSYPALREYRAPRLLPTKIRSPVEPLPRRNGYWSPTAWAAGLDWSAAPSVWIYVMESSGFAKVGLTIDVAKRLRGLTASSPVPISLCDALEIRADVASWCEHIAHKALFAFHSHSEWFRCSALEALAAVKAAITSAEEIPQSWVYNGNNPGEWARVSELKAKRDADGPAKGYPKPRPR